MTQGTPLDKILQQLTDDLEADPTFNPEKLADVKRASALLTGMMEGGSNANDAIHALVFMTARILIMACPAEDEVNVREQYTHMLFDYMTAAMTTEVCVECGYPHDHNLPCDEIEPELAVEELSCYIAPSAYSH